MEEVRVETIRRFDCDDDCDQPASLRGLLESLHRKVDQLMADVSALEAAVENLTVVEGAAAAELSALAAEVAQLTAGEITQEQIDGITQKVTDTANALTAATQAAEPEAEQPSEPPVGEEPPAEPPAEEPAPPAAEPPVAEPPVEPAPE